MRHPIVPRAVRPVTSAVLLALVAACTTDRATTAPSADVVSATVAEQAASVHAGPPQYVAGELLVKFKPGASALSRGAAMRAANATAAEKILTASMRRAGDSEGVTVVRTMRDVPGAMAALVESGAVEYAEPNWIYQHEAVSNDTYYTNGSLWGMYGATTLPATNQYGTGAGTAWANGKENCSSSVIGIIDEGYMYTHPELAGNAFKNPREVEGNGKDDDGNGFVDDVYGWDFDGNNNTVFDGATDDHGTHVAGTIGAAGGNGAGVAGVCWQVGLMSAKFLGGRGGTTANAVKAVDYFSDMKTRNGVNIVATSNSWGGGGFSSALDAAIERANAAGILFIAAAGNSSLNCDTSDCYPAEYSRANVIAVASITNTGALSSFSNYGANTIHIGAPGSGIWSTVPVRSGGRVVASYASYNGTSMATPHVSGAAALYAAQHPGSSSATIKAEILRLGTATTSLAGKTISGSRLNVSGF